MTLDEVSHPNPVRLDADGVRRVGSTRVRLASIVQHHLQGATPEEIQERLPSLPLAEIYAVIAYYLRHHAHIDAYLAEEPAEAERVRRDANARPATRALRKKLRDRRNRRGQASDSPS